MIRRFIPLAGCLLLGLFFFPAYGDESRDLAESRKSGDFQRVDYLRSLLEKERKTPLDQVEEASLSRLLYLETIRMPDDLIFDDSLSSLEVDGDDVWIGSRSGDIARYSLSEREWKSFVRGEESLAIRAVQAILPEAEHLWFLSYGSVAVYSKRHDRFYSLDIPDDKEYRGMQSAVIAGRGLIAGTQGSGLRRIRLDGHSVIPLEPPLRNITFLADLNDGCLVAGSEEQGVYILDDNFMARPLTRAPRRTSAVRSILPRDDDYLAGSYGGGLFQLVRSGGGYDIVFLDAPSLWITDGVKLDNGIFCFSTLGQGLTAVEGENDEIRTYGIGDGLGGLDISQLAYSPPYLICAVQGLGLVKIHENYFAAP